MSSLTQPNSEPGLPKPITPLLLGFKSQLHQRFGSRLREVTLFGSWARGHVNEESDVDVLVVVDDLTSVERREIWDLAYRLDAPQGEPLWHLSPLCYATSDAASLRSRERRLVREIAEQGRPV